MTIPHFLDYGGIKKYLYDDNKRLWIYRAADSRKGEHYEILKDYAPKPTIVKPCTEEQFYRNVSG